MAHYISIGRSLSIYSTSQGLSASGGGGPGPFYEQYATTNTGVSLYWTRYMPSEGGPTFPFVIGLHPGGYKSGSSVLQRQGLDCAAAGFIFCGTEYRLAPPAAPMNSQHPIVPGLQPGQHPSVAQNEIPDFGHCPEQTTDVSAAVRVARAHPLCNGMVYGVGGSAGASHIMWNLANATPGDDRFDLGVCLSPGLFDLYRSEIWAIPCGDTETCPHGAVANYLNVTDTFPNTPTGSDLLSAQAASPSFHWSNAVGGKIWTLTSTRDSRGIPTSIGFPMSSFNLDGTPAVYETNVTTGYISACQLVGLTESTAIIPEAGKYKKTIVEVSAFKQHAHAFDYWNLPINGVSGQTVAQAIIIWLQGGPP